MPARRDAHRAGNGDAGGRPISPAPLPAPDRTRRPRLRHSRRLVRHGSENLMTETSTPNTRRLTREDIVPPGDSAAIRRDRRERITETKRRRRVEVGPIATFYFENYETMRHQVQEMLHIEQGGDAQIEDELAAYNPLVPQGMELVATVMFEVDDPARRAAVLARLGGIEDHVFLDIA